MFVIKLMLKVVCIPVLIILIIIQWMAIFATEIASIILKILSTLFWGFAIVGLLFGAINGHEAVGMIVAAFVVFVIPQICCWLTNVLGTFRLVFDEFIRS